MRNTKKNGTKYIKERKTKKIIKRNIKGRGREGMKGFIMILLIIFDRV